MISCEKEPDPFHFMKEHSTIAFITRFLCVEWERFCCA